MGAEKDNLYQNKIKSKENKISLHCLLSHRLSFCRVLSFCISTLTFIYSYFTYFGPDSSIGIATGYGLDGPGIESRGGGGEIFRTCLDRLWGPPSLLYNWYCVFPEVKERPGRGADPSPPSSAVVMKG